MTVCILLNVFQVGLAPVVQKMENAFQWINHYSLDSVVGFTNAYWTTGTSQTDNQNVIESLCS